MPATPSGESSPRLRVARVVLLALAAGALEVGIWALFFPKSFFASFPGAGRAWTAALPPYNEHLVRDVGGFNLMLAALFVWAVVTTDRRLITAASLSSLLFAVPHMVFHLLNLGPFGTADRIAQTLLISLTVAGPVAAVILVRGAEPKVTRSHPRPER